MSTRILDINSPEPCLVLDGSGLAEFLHCRQRYQFRYLSTGSGLVASTDPIPLVAGGAVHDALAVRYRTSRGGPVSPEVRAAMSTAQIKRWTGSTAAPDWRSPAHVETLLDAYLLEYPTEPFVVREVETPFARSLGKVTVEGRSFGVIWQGRRDLVVSYLGTEGKEWIMDHKTAQSESNILQSWGQSLSQLGYVWSRQQFTGKPLEGFIMNILGWRKPTVKASKLPRFWFERVPILVSASQLEEWQEHVLAYAGDIIRSMLTGIWPKSGDCFDYGAQCQYWDACLARPDSRERMLCGGGYKRNDWTPLHE